MKKEQKSRTGHRFAYRDIKIYDKPNIWLEKRVQRDQAENFDNYNYIYVYTMLYGFAANVFHIFVDCSAYSTTHTQQQQQHTLIDQIQRFSYLWIKYANIKCNMDAIVPRKR